MYVEGLRALFFVSVEHFCFKVRTGYFATVFNLLRRNRGRAGEVAIRDEANIQQRNRFGLPTIYSEEAQRGYATMLLMPLWLIILTVASKRAWLMPGLAGGTLVSGALLVIWPFNPYVGVWSPSRQTVMYQGVQADLVSLMASAQAWFVILLTNCISLAMWLGIFSVCVRWRRFSTSVGSASDHLSDIVGFGLLCSLINNVFQKSFLLMWATRKLRGKTDH